VIPIKLAMRNFMCYRDNVSPLHFDAIHLACLCGDNGNGKSALVDAITWALWGKTRAKSDDELIHLGQKEMEVEFEFAAGANHYRVLRKRTKSRPGHPGQVVLELQLATSEGFQSISGNSLGETQQRIIHILHMDYPTFVNSTFLRQGHADEFTIKPPGERKKVLANILGLSVYDELAEEAKNQAKQRQQRIKELDSAIKEMGREIERRGEYQAELSEVSKALGELAQQVSHWEGQVIALRDAKRGLEFKQEKRAELAQICEQEQRESNFWHSSVAEHKAKVGEYEQVLSSHSQVEQGYFKLEQMKKEAEELNLKLRALLSLTERKADLEKTIEKSKAELAAEQKVVQSKVNELEAKSQKKASLEGELAQLQTRLSEIGQQEKELEGSKQQAQELAFHIQQSKSAHTQLAQEIKELENKLALLRQGDVNCPLCETELGVEGRERIEQKYKLGLKSKLDSQAQNEVEVTQKGRGHRQLVEKNTQLELEINSKQVAWQRRTATLEKEIGEAQEAAEKLEKEKRHLAELVGKVTKEDFAQDMRIALFDVEQQLGRLAYVPQRHQQLQQLVASLEKYAGLWRILEEAERSLPVERVKLAEAKENLRRTQANLEGDEQKLIRLSSEVVALPELTDRLREVEQTYSLWQHQQAEGQRKLGAVQQKLDYCVYVERMKKAKAESLEQALREEEIYQELAEAFGRKGIQAFIIESALPEIEAEANSLLGRMTDNRMQVRIETQRESKKGEIIETLDINISDELGRRSYEMYSGGEAFRINLALRIALSKLLARRAGAPLPTLIIDEGFGTQDQSSLGKLVEAINSIGDDFEKVIVITHLEELKDAFPARIEVTKTTTGSQILVS